MSNKFEFSIPTTSAAPTLLTLSVGEVLYILGANGSGKSSLVSHLYGTNREDAKRISAHRQTWFESNTLEMTARSRHDLENTIRNEDAQLHSRYREWNPKARSNVAIYDLIDADTTQERKIAALVRAGDMVAAEKHARNPSPIQVINELMRLSNLSIEIGMEEGQKIVARKNGGPGYSVAELSDGERNAFLIAISVLTAKAGTLILVDEPERHLLRSIMSPLLKLLFEKRKDCAFVVSTHELMLPVDTPGAATLLVRSCQYRGVEVESWAMDLLPPGAVIDEDLKRDILGSRRKMLFVEGTATSLDAPLYSMLFPGVSVIPKDGCRDVEHAVKGLRGAREMHWISAWGIVDNDQRPEEDIKRLRGAGIWALSNYSVESLYYHSKIVARAALRQAQVTGLKAEPLVKAAIEDAIVAVKAQKDHFVKNAVLRSARETIFRNLPTRDDIDRGNSIKVEVDLRHLCNKEEHRFDSLVASEDWDGLLARYPLRESAAFDRVIAGIRIADRSTYRSAVLTLLQDDASALAELRDQLGDLNKEIDA